MGEIVVGIDIGTSKVCAMIGQVNKAGQLEVLGAGLEPCTGVKKGIIVDVESMAQAIKSSIHKAETMAGLKVGSAFVNISGMHVRIIDNKSSLNIAGETREITKKDVEKLLYAVHNVTIPQDMQVIDIVPRQYIIDGYDEIMDPVGMVGVKLELEADIVAGKITSVQNIVKSMEKAGVGIDGVVVEGMASAEILLTPDERDLGVVMLDIGAGITDISVFRNKKLVYYDSVPVGGDHITNDISIGMKISPAEAEKIKKEYELALTSLISNDQELTVTDVTEGKRKSVRISEVVEIIEARVFEIFSICREKLEAAGVLSCSGVVLTGEGISHFDGAIQLAYEVFDIPVRIANYKVPGVFKSDYSTASGIIRFVSGNQKAKGTKSEVKVQKKKKPVSENNLFKKIGSFFRELFL